jgi:hypothetical protein
MSSRATVFLVALERGELCEHVGIFATLDEAQRVAQATARRHAPDLSPDNWLADDSSGWWALGGDQQISVSVLRFTIGKTAAWAIHTTTARAEAEPAVVR